MADEILKIWAPGCSFFMFNIQVTDLGLHPAGEAFSKDGIAEIALNIGQARKLHTALGKFLKGESL